MTFSPNYFLLFIWLFLLVSGILTDSSEEHSKHHHEKLHEPHAARNLIGLPFLPSRRSIPISQSLIVRNSPLTAPSDVEIIGVQPDPRGFVVPHDLAHDLGYPEIHSGRRQKGSSSSSSESSESVEHPVIPRLIQGRPDDTPILIRIIMNSTDHDKTNLLPNGNNQPYGNAIANTVKNNLDKVQNGGDNLEPKRPNAEQESSETVQTQTTNALPETTSPETVPPSTELPSEATTNVSDGLNSDNDKITAQNPQSPQRYASQRIRSIARNKGKLISPLNSHPYQSRENLQQNYGTNDNIVQSNYDEHNPQYTKTRYDYENQQDLGSRGHSVLDYDNYRGRHVQMVDDAQQPANSLSRDIRRRSYPVA